MSLNVVHLPFYTEHLKRFMFEKKPVFTLNTQQQQFNLAVNNNTNGKRKGTIWTHGFLL